MSSPSTPQPVRTESRASSFNFLRRASSRDYIAERKTSGSRLKKKQSMEADRLKLEVAKSPPTLPGLEKTPDLQTFGGEDYKPKSKTPLNGVPPVPPLPTHMEREAFDPYARTESMTHRGRYSYATSTHSTVNGPRRVRRRKDPTPYNMLVIGARNSGKTSLIDFLKSSLQLPLSKRSNRPAEDDSPPPSSQANRSFTRHFQEIELEGERIGLTLWDSHGLEKSVVELQMRELSNFVESKFNDSFIEEMKVVRSPGVRDTHIHCVLWILDPVHLDSNVRAAQQIRNGDNVNSRVGKVQRILGCLDEDFDLQVLRTLLGKTVVVPIISKADTITAARMAFLKKAVVDSLKKAGLDPLAALNVSVEDDEDRLDEKDEEDDEHSSHPGSGDSDDSETVPSEANTKRQRAQKRQSLIPSFSNSMLDSGYIPLSIISPDEYSLDPKSGPVGRHFPWGFADPYNAQHCDFVKMREACFSEWRADLREISRETFYERWRTNRLNRQPVSNGSRNTPEPRKTSAGIPIPLNRGITR